MTESNLWSLASTPLLRSKLADGTYCLDCIALLFMRVWGNERVQDAPKVGHARCPRIAMPIMKDAPISSLDCTGFCGSDLISFRSENLCREPRAFIYHIGNFK